MHGGTKRLYCYDILVLLLFSIEGSISSLSRGRLETQIHQAILASRNEEALSKIHPSSASQRGVTFHCQLAQHPRTSTLQPALAGSKSFVAAKISGAESPKCEEVSMRLAGAMIFIFLLPAVFHSMWASCGAGFSHFTRH